MQKTADSDLSNNVINKHQDHSPVIVHVDSKTIKLDSGKFLAQNDLIFGHFLNIIKKKMHNVNSGELHTLKFNIVQDNSKKISINDEISNLTVKQVFDKYKNNSLNTLFINIYKDTTFKWIKRKSLKIFGY